jgi:hypothetical protein
MPALELSPRPLQPSFFGRYPYGFRVAFFEHPFLRVKPPLGLHFMVSSGAIRLVIVSTSYRRHPYQVLHRVYLFILRPGSLEIRLSTGCYVTTPGPWPASSSRSRTVSRYLADLQDNGIRSMSA